MKKRANNVFFLASIRKQGSCNLNRSRTCVFLDQERKAKKHNSSSCVLTISIPIKTGQKRRIFQIMFICIKEKQYRENI
jgi:hypothetical protein